MQIIQTVSIVIVAECNYLNYNYFGRLSFRTKQFMKIPLQNYLEQIHKIMDGSGG